MDSDLPEPSPKRYFKLWPSYSVRLIPRTGGFLHGARKAD